MNYYLHSEDWLYWQGMLGYRGGVEDGDYNGVGGGGGVEDWLYWQGWGCWVGEGGAVKDCGCTGRGCRGGVLKAMVLVGRGGGGGGLFKTVVMLAGDVRKGGWGGH